MGKKINNKYNNKLLGVLVLFFSIMLLASCSSNKKDTTTSANSNKEVVNVATDGTDNPYGYVVNNKLKGYDIDLLRSIFKSQNKYKLKFHITEFDSILGGLDSNRFDIGANNFVYNKVRAEKYLYSDPIQKNPYVFVVRKNDNSINKNFSSLAGKKALAVTGGGGTVLLEEYNKKHPNNKVNISYTQADTSKQFQQIESGQYDVLIISNVMAHRVIKQNSYKLKTIIFKEAAKNPYAYYLLSKTSKGRKLKLFINKRLKKLISNGTMKKLSEKYYGTDYVPY
jgi:polar amino acid transport system substrate-binding protein